MDGNAGSDARVPMGLGGVLKLIEHGARRSGHAKGPKARPAVRVAPGRRLDRLRLEPHLDGGDIYSLVGQTPSE